MSGRAAPARSKAAAEGPSNAALATAQARLAELHAGQGPVSGRGLEALIAGATLAASRGTWLLPGERERGCALLRGASADALDAARPYRVVPPGTSPVARAAYAVGLAARGDRALVFCGTGTTGYGDWAAAVSLAVERRAEVVFLVAAYADAQGQPGADAPFAVQLSGGPAAVARGMGAAGVVVDGRDASAVHEAVRAASGPTVIEARLRLGA